MAERQRIPKRSILDLIYVTGNLRIVDSILAVPPGLSVPEVEAIMNQSLKYEEARLEEIKAYLEAR